MTADMHSLTGAYATHALPDDERVEFERHVGDCEVCTQELRELEATAARLGAALAGPVSPGLRTAVLTEVARTRQLPPLTRGAADARRAAWWQTPLAAVAASLLIACAGLAGVLADQRAELAEAQREAAAVAEIAGHPDVRRATARTTQGGTVTVMHAGTRAVVLASDLPPAGEDRTYQLWLMHDDGVTPAGLLDLEDEGEGGHVIEDMRAAKGVAISVEPEGGSQQPTTTPIVAVDLA